MEPAARQTVRRCQLLDSYRPGAAARAFRSAASGLDPDITMDNAHYQLDRVASKWASELKRDPAQVRGDINAILQSDAYAPMYGLFGEKMVNVLRVNLELRKRFGAPTG